MKLLAKIVIAVVIFVAGFYVGTQQALSPSNGSQEISQPAEKEEIGVNLMLDFGNGQVRTFSGVMLLKEATVFDLLEKITSENNLKLGFKDYGELGAFIESIGDITNDTKGDRFWQFWVNNEYGQIGSSNYHLKDGDIVEWKFIRGQIN